MGVLELFDRGADSHPDRTCLLQGETRRSYREVAARTQRVAGALHHGGIAAGHRVAVYSPNCIAAYEAMLGIYRAGAVFVPANPKAHVAENIYILNQCETRALLYHSSLADEVAEIRRECASIHVWVCLDRLDGSACAFDAWAAAAQAPQSMTRVSRDTLVSIYSTGGTTGRPKGVMFTSLTWDVVAANFLSALDCPDHPVFLLAAPMTHGAGTCSIAVLPRGATVVILDQFDAGDVLAAIEHHGVTHLFLPPTAIYMLLEHPNLRAHDYRSLVGFIYAGAPMSVEKLKTAMDVFGPVMMQCYGQTEAPMFCTALTPADHVASITGSGARLASCGRPLLLTRVEIMNDQGELVPRHTRGEIVVQGDLVMAGYYNNPQATAEVSKFGWHHTGDVGMKDDDGYVYIVDRLKDMIITGGFNVYPTEVEQVIWSHPSVLECAVIGVPDEKWGEAVKAVIELRRGSEVSPEEIIAYCKARIGSIKSPKSVEVWETLPRTPVGKVSKKDIRERYWRNFGRTI